MMPTKKKPVRKSLGRVVPSDYARAKSSVDGRKHIWYVGRDSRGGLTVFRSAKKPTEASHGHRFTSVNGPMSKSAAEDWKSFSWGASGR